MCGECGESGESGDRATVTLMVLNREEEEAGRGKREK